MRLLLGVSVLCCFVLSCNKSNDADNTTSLCLDTTFIYTGINALQSVYFLTGKDGFVSNYNGSIYKTTDSARTWTLLSTTTSLPIRDIFFTNAQTGFAVGGVNSCTGNGCTPAGGFIMKTIDGGQTWANVFTPTDKVEISSVYFVNSNEGYCAGDNVIFKTSNAGQTWSEYKINNLGGKMMQIRFVNAQKGYVACLFDKIVVTEDGGTTWQVKSPNRNIGYYAIAEANGSTYVSGQGKIIKSMNGGNSWQELPNSPSDIFNIHFLNSQVGFAFGRGNYSGGDFGYHFGCIYCTNDGGATWNGTSNIAQTSTIQAVSFPTNQIAYAVSGNKVIKMVLK